MVTPTGILDQQVDTALILSEEFSEPTRTPQGSVRDRRRRCTRRPHWDRSQGVGRLVTTVAEARRFLASAHADGGGF